MAVGLLLAMPSAVNCNEINNAPKLFNPITARLQILTMYPNLSHAVCESMVDREPMNVTFQKQVSFFGYYLLQCLEDQRIEKDKFKVVFELWLDGYQKLTGNKFSVSSADDYSHLKNALLSTKTGQQFIRFPRISLIDNDCILKRYPAPEIYGKTGNIEIIKADSKQYKKYLELLQREKCLPGQEIALISFRGYLFDWFDDKDE